MPNKDNIKGKAKEAAGDLTDDERLKREGKTDRAAGSVKDTVSNAADKAKDVASDAADKAKDALHKD
jgi:uncharacterized protein YjbJ (UPF0337 family)